MKFIYPAVFRQTESGGYRAWFPDLECCEAHSRYPKLAPDGCERDMDLASEGYPGVACHYSAISHGEIESISPLWSGEMGGAGGGIHEPSGAPVWPPLPAGTVSLRWMATRMGEVWADAGGMKEPDLS